MRITQAITVAGLVVALAPTTVGAFPEGAVPLPRFKPSLAELSNFRAMRDDVRIAMYQALAVRLEARLEEDGSDLESWLRLARTRALLDQRERALKAFEHALELAPRSPSVIKGYAGAALGPVDPESGWPEVTPEARGLYERLVLIDPSDREARWYLGLYALQQGDRRTADEHWQTLLQLLPPDAAGAAALRERLDALHAVAGPPAS